ncbi:hypothetical protein G9A89_023626 [Geosiphon pyriformis]|nr:hypothetical protein G9A89_023626 [Geosiphon pyriformis]
MAYWDIAKLEKFSGEEDDTEKAITANTSYLSLMEDQSFDKSTPVERENIEQISQSSKQTKNNIPPATITKDTTLATIFPFDINNLNTHSLFSRAAINQDKPITALYTNARVERIGH